MADWRRLRCCCPPSSPPTYGSMSRAMPRCPTAGRPARSRSRRAGRPISASIRRRGSSCSASPNRRSARPARRSARSPNWSPSCARKPKSSEPGAIPMTSLVLLDHAGGAIKQPSRSAVAAAQKLGEVHALVAGTESAAAVTAAAKLPGVAKVLVADAPALDRALAEPLAALLVSLAPSYSHLLAAATAIGKNVMPRVAALLDLQPISDIAGVVDADTFVRPIYAGNGMATVKSSDAKKIITVRAASFDPVEADGGSAAIETVSVGVITPELSQFVSAELSKSERPELTA